MSCVNFSILNMIAGAAIWTVLITAMWTAYDLTKMYIDNRVQEKVDEEVQGQ